MCRIRHKQKAPAVKPGLSVEDHVPVRERGWHYRSLGSNLSTILDNISLAPAPAGVKRGAPVACAKTSP